MTDMTKIEEVSSEQLSFLEEIFRPTIKNLLHHRADSFEIMFQLLEKKSEKNFTIVETGTSRQPNNWRGDGQSTILWDRFVYLYDGMVFSVDISMENCQAAASQCSPKTTLVCSDSVSFLNQVGLADVDLLYMDSFDVDFNAPHPSALHHLKELCASWCKLKSGCIIAVDDHNFGVGKGTYVKDFFENIGVKPVFEGYQIVYVKP
jgi:hypothetical protein